EPGSMIELEARMWPVGSARVRITLRQVSPTETEIVFEEEASGGPLKLLPESAQAAFLRPRNVESLRRLTDIAAGRGSGAARGRPLSASYALRRIARGSGRGLDRSSAEPR